MAQRSGPESDNQGVTMATAGEVVDLDATIPAIPPIPSSLTLWEVLHNLKHAPATVYVGMLGLSPDPTLTDWVGARAAASGHADAFKLLRDQWQRRVANRGELLAQSVQLLHELKPEEQRQLLATVKRVVEQDGQMTMPAWCFHTHVRALFNAMPTAQAATAVQSAQDIDRLLAVVASQADCRELNEDRLQAARVRAATELTVQPVKLRPQPVQDAESGDQLLARLRQRSEAERKAIARACVMISCELERAVWNPAEQADNRLPALSPASAELLHAVHAALGLPLRSRPAGWPRRNSSN